MLFVVQEGDNGEMKPRGRQRSIDLALE